MTIAIVNERLAIMVLTTLESSLILLDNLKKANINHPFIGTKEELMLTFNTMCDLNKLVYKENHIDYNDITYFYDRPFDVSDKFNSSLHLIN